MAVAEWPTTLPAEIRHPAVASAVSSTRFYFGVLSLLGLAAFVFNIDNRASANSLLAVAPPVDFIPPFSVAGWSAAYAYHLQDPLFAACGGAVTLGQFQFMYRWEWLRQASLAALVGWSVAGFAAAAAWRQYRCVLPRLSGLALLLIACGAARVAAEFATGEFRALSSLNVGQYRHAMDVTLASTALAALFATSITPHDWSRRIPSVRARPSEWLWTAAILLDIGFGALFAARNATPFWPTWPGYDGQLLPPLAQMTSYSPWWLNLTFNPYTIQLAGQILLGIVTLVLAVPAALSVAHQIGAVFLLAFSFTVLRSPDERMHGRPSRIWHLRQTPG